MKYAVMTMDIEPGPGGNTDFFLFNDTDYYLRFREIISIFDLSMTGFVVTSLLESNPAIFRSIQDDLQIEFEVHSHSHDPANPDSRSEIKQSIETFKNFFGRRPRGYRAPIGLITDEGLRRLGEYGFQYDSSIFPSLRFGKWSYMNLNLPNTPFLYETGGSTLYEIPVGTINGVRMVISLSYLKLFGWEVYEVLIDWFGLPEMVIIDTHPYDFTVRRHLTGLNGLNRWAHGRNAENTMEIFEALLQKLDNLGYEFVSMSGLIQEIKERKNSLPVRSSLSFG